MVDINDPRNYKRCQRKQYKIWCCKLPKGTYAINVFEQHEIWRQLNGRSIITYDEAKKRGILQLLDNLTLSGRVYKVVTDNDFLLSGTQGEVWLAKLDKIAKTYRLQNGMPITPQSLNRMIKRIRYSTIIDWFEVETLSTQEGINMACHVPKTQRGEIATSWGAKLTVNGVGVSHGTGDFIVCEMLPNGMPNLNDRWVVNGLIFVDTYDNINFSDEIKSRKSTPPRKPKSILSI